MAMIKAWVVLRLHQGPEPDMQNQLTLTLAAEGEGNRLFEAV